MAGMDESQRIDLAQGSTQWLEWRRRRLQASEAAIVMGCAPDYWQLKTVDQLRDVKAGAEPPPVTDWVRNMWLDGHEREHRVRSEINRRDWADYQPACFERGLYGASLDGYWSTGGRWLEIKAPASPESLTLVLANGYGPQNDPKTFIPEHYWWQLVQQAYCLPPYMDICIYAVHPPWNGIPIEIEVTHARLLKDWPKLEAAWESSGVLGKIKARPVVQEDEEIRISHEWIEANRAAKLAADRLKRARSALLRLDQTGVIGGLVRVEEVRRKGSIDYKTAATKHYGEEALERFRRPDSKYVRIKEVSK